MASVLRVSASGGCAWRGRPPSAQVQAEGRMAVFRSIEGFHNPTKHVSASGSLSPIEYEARDRPIKD